MDIFRILAVILGLGLVLFGILYKKKDHKDFDKNASSAVSGLIDFVIIFVLTIVPWYITKSIFILIGLLITIAALLVE